MSGSDRALKSLKSDVTIATGFGSLDATSTTNASIVTLPRIEVRPTRKPAARPTLPSITWTLILVNRRLMLTSRELPRSTSVKVADVV